MAVWGNMDPRTVRASRIRKSVTRDELRQEFGRYGRVTWLRLVEEAGATNHCFVHFSTEKDAQDAAAGMNEECLDGGRIRCNLKTLRALVYPVRVDNVPRRSTEEEVECFFQCFGEVVSVKIPDLASPRPHAFVNFRDDYVAGWAQSDPPNMNGRSLRVHGQKPREIFVVAGGTQCEASARWGSFCCQWYDQRISWNFTFDSIWTHRFAVGTWRQEMEALAHWSDVDTTLEDESIGIDGSRKFVYAVLGGLHELRKKLEPKIKSDEVTVQGYGDMWPFLRAKYESQLVLIKGSGTSFLALVPTQAASADVKIELGTLSGRRLLKVARQKVETINAVVAAVMLEGTASGVAGTDLSGALAVAIAQEIKDFLHGEEVIEQEFCFTALDVVRTLIMKARWKAITGMLESHQLRRCDFNPEGTEREACAAFTVGGKRCNILKFEEEFIDFQKHLSDNLRHTEFPVTGIEMLLLPLCTSEIEQLAAHDFGLFTWSFCAPQPPESVPRSRFDVDDDMEFAIESSRPSGHEAASSPPSLWEWKDDGDWKEYSESISTAIELAHEGREKLACSINQSTYHIHPQALVQINMATLKRRPIRRKTCADGSRQLVYVWQFTDSKGSARDYDAAATVQLEAAYQRKENAVLVLNTQGSSAAKYVVHLDSMEQTNVATKKVRKVRRVQVARTTPAQQFATPDAAVTGTNRHTEETFSPLGVGSLPACVSVGIANFTDAKHSSEESAEEFLSVIKKMLKFEQISIAASFPRSFLVRLRNLSRLHCVAVKVRVHGDECRNEVIVSGAADRVRTAVHLVNEWAVQVLSDQAEHVRKPVKLLNFPDNWESQDKNCELKLVSSSSLEFAEIEKLLKSTMPTAVLQRLERVQNKRLWRNFVQVKESIAEKLEVRLAEVKEEKLFHGTGTTKPEEVCQSEHGFASSTGPWGEGTYFSTTAVHANRTFHASRTFGVGWFGMQSRDDRQLLLAMMCVGDAAIDIPPDRLRRKPPQKMAADASQVIGKVLYDCVTGCVDSHRVYVTYAKDQAYPLYLLTYSP